MVKLLLLQPLYNLCDDALEDPVLDRRSFQQFLGLAHSGKVPDAKTIWVWRERRKRKDLVGDISAAIGQQLQRAGFHARGGQIIDASMVTAPIQRNTREENAQIKKGEDVGQDWSDAKRAQKDVQARWTRKPGVAFYGDKLHARTERRWGFLRRHDVSAGNVHDSRHFEPVLDPANSSRTVWAGSGYADAGREADLKERRYRPAIQHQGQARKPLSQRGKRRNRRIAKDRVFGEHPFARLPPQGGKCLRSIGLARTKVVIGLKVASPNLMRLARLQHRALSPA